MNPAYSDLKALRHLDVVTAAKEGKPHRPVNIMLHITDLCNMACSFCSYRSPGFSNSQLFKEYDPLGTKGLRKDGYEEYNFNPNRMIPFEKICEILDDCKAMGVSGITFTGGGEPTVHPRFLDVIKYTRSLGLKFALVTNGSLIKEKGLADEVSYAEWIRFSLDAGDKATYAKMREVPEAFFFRVLDSVKTLREARERNATKIAIGVNFVVTPDNWPGIFEAAVHAYVSGADSFRVSAQISEKAEDLFAGFHDQVIDLCAQAKGLETDTFKVIARFESRVDEIKQIPQHQRCGYQEFTTVIGADLGLYRCVIYAYNERGQYGSLKNARFRDVWEHHDRASAFKCFDARGCRQCQYVNINQKLDYVLQEENPHHSEFV